MAENPSREQVVSLINNAQLSNKTEKLECLRKVHELLIHKDIELLDSFYDEVLAFQQDPSHEVRKLVVSFVEEACKVENLFLDRTLPQLLYMFDDSNITVTKRVASAIISLYPLMMKTIIHIRSTDSREIELLKEINQLKTKVLELIYSENDGCHTLAIKFMEAAILVQTDCQVIPERHPILPVVALRVEADNMIKSMVTLAKSVSLASVNIMACVSSLLNLARKRADYVEFAVEVVDSLSYNMLETFSESQRNSIRKQLKVHCLNLIREPHALEHHTRLERVALSLGCSQSEISKACQKANSMLKDKRARVHPASSLEQSDPKKAKELDLDDDENVILHPPSQLSSQLSTTKAHHRRKELSLIEEITSIADQIVPALVDIDTVIDTVISSMAKLPPDIPQSFSQIYQVAHSPGTPEQIQETACLLAAQLVSIGGESVEHHDMMDQSATLAGVRARMKRVSVLGSPREGKSHDPVFSEVEQISERQRSTVCHIANSLGLFETILLSDEAFVRYVNKELDDDDNENEEESMIKPAENSDVVEGGVAEILSSIQSEKRPKKMINASPKKMPVAPPQLHVQKLKRSRLYHISDLIKDSGEDEANDVGMFAFNRLLNHPLSKEDSNAQDLLKTELAGILARDFDNLKDAFVQFLLMDPRKNSTLISNWLYQEYIGDHESLAKYEDSLILLLESCQVKFGPRNQFFSEIVQNAPCITPGVLQMIEMFCHTEENSVMGLTTLKDLLLNGCGREDTCLQILFDATLSGSPQCRVNALTIAKKLHGSSSVSKRIEDLLQNILLKLVYDPPSDEDKHIVGEEWNESAVKLCLGLFCILLPQNHHFLSRMAEVYAKTTPQVKRMILKQIESVVIELPLSSKGVLTLIHQCPAGAETLVLRLLSLLVKSCVPPREVVESTKHLYEQSGKDVRFLIPVIKGLTKREIRDTLPQIVSLSSGSLLKTVVHKLVAEDHSPITMTDLLVLLHDIDCTDNEELMKAIIKATSLCLSDKSLISSEVLMAVIKEVLRRSPLPIIFMRTVLQTYNMYPHLIDFVITVLDELIVKEIWKAPKLWQGFVHCCEVSKPHSFPVVMKLPKEQLLKLSSSGSSLKAAIDAHLQSLPNEPVQDSEKNVAETDDSMDQ